MDAQQVQKMHATLKGEMDALEREVREKAERLDHVRQVVEGLEHLYPDLRRDNEVRSSESTESRDHQPVESLRSAVRTLLERDPQRWWKTSDALTHLEAQGWEVHGKYPDATLRRVFRELHESGEAERTKLDGRTVAYRAVSDSSATAGTENDPAVTGPFSGSLQKGEHDDPNHHRGHPAMTG